jgi:hypothetical protein
MPAAGTYPFYAAFAHGAEFGRDAAVLASAYRDAEPFPHIVVDGMFSADVLDAVAGEIPSPIMESELLFSADVPALQERKFAFRDVPAFGPSSHYLINTLNAKPFLEFLTEVTGIGGLMSDPYLVGGGFHQIVRGGLLSVHADFNVHPVTRAYRRLNLLLYLNRGWPEEWGGELELWPADLSGCSRRIAPIFNRMVVFSTTETSFHGHPHPLSCPPDAVRRSLALYYYTVERLDAEEHSTLWQRLSPRST